jgi:hypothetical protein
VEILKVKNPTDSDLKLEEVTFRPSSEDFPEEAKKIRIMGLQEVTLAKEKSTPISVFFPEHTKVGKYEGQLYFKTTEESSKPVPFHSLKVEIKDPYTPLMGRPPAVLVALGLSMFILFITLWIKGKTNAELSFFQSPTGGYSASKFQIWLWTVVIIYSFVYLFLRRGAVAEFPESIWWLLGISVGSTGTAKFITVRRLGRRASAAISPGEREKPSDSVVDKLASMLSEHGQLSLMRLQMFGWTVVTALLFVVHVFRIEELWNVPTGLLVLMGISHIGYLGDKGAAPDTTLELDRLTPKAMSASATKNATLLIFGQNFAEKIECHLGSVQLTVDEKSSSTTRLRATLPPGGLAPGKYDISLQNPRERAKVEPDAFEVT